MLCGSHLETKNMKLLIFGFSSINLAFWWFFFYFFMRFGRFQTLMCELQSSWRKQASCTELTLPPKVYVRPVYDKFQSSDLFDFAFYLLHYLSTSIKATSRKNSETKLIRTLDLFVIHRSDKVKRQLFRVSWKDFEVKISKFNIENQSTSMVLNDQSGKLKKLSCDHFVSHKDGNNSFWIFWSILFWVSLKF